MAAVVENYGSFKSQLEKAKNSCDLFGFVLFDDRASHLPIKQFFTVNFEWMDSLAVLAEMIIFLPLEAVDKSKASGSNRSRNCSLQIANVFCLRPNQLPAFLFFTLKAGEMCVEHSAILQFKPGAFAGDATEGQDLVSDLFSAVTSARRDQASSEIIVKLKAEIDRIKRAEQVRPIKKWANEFIITLADIPKDIARSLAEAGVKRLVGI